MADVKVSRRKITDYTPDPHNANQGTERGQYLIDHSVESVGLARSIVAANDDTIPAGNKTLQAAVDAGIEDVIEVETDGRALVVVKRTDWAGVDDPAARKYAYLDNRAGEVGLDWDAAVISGDIDAGIDLGDLWFPHELEDFEQEADMDGLPEVGRTTKIDTSRLIRVALYGDGVALLEKAIIATGEENRAEAVKLICRAYLNEERQLDF